MWYQHLPLCLSLSSVRRRRRIISSRRIYLALDLLPASLARCRARSTRRFAVGPFCLPSRRARAPCLPLGAYQARSVPPPAAWRRASRPEPACPAPARRLPPPPGGRRPNPCARLRGAVLTVSRQEATDSGCLPARRAAPPSPAAPVHSSHLMTLPAARPRRPCQLPSESTRSFRTSRRTRPPPAAQAPSTRTCSTGRRPSWGRCVGRPRCCRRRPCRPARRPARAPPWRRGRPPRSPGCHPTPFLLSLAPSPPAFAEGFPV